MSFFQSSLFAVLALSFSVFSVGQDRGGLVGELDSFFSGSLANPGAYRARVNTECLVFPEGDLTPYTFVAASWCHLIYENPARHASKIQLVENALDLAVSSAVRRIKPPGGDFQKLTSTNGYGSHLARLAMALSSYRLAGGKRSDLVAIERNLILVLSAEVAAKKGTPIDSYPDEIRPLDTTIAIFAIELHDRLGGTDTASALLASHRNWVLERGIDQATNLPGCEFYSNGRVGPARGCDLSWRLALWREMDPGEGQRWYQIYRKNFWTKATVAQGFREWGSGDKTTDYRSGPILAGIGGSATVLGLSTSMCYEDRAATDLILLQAGKLSKSRRSKDFISRVLARTIDNALKRTGIEPVPGFITGFLYGDAMAFYAVSWHDYPDKVVGL